MLIRLKVIQISDWLGRCRRRRRCRSLVIQNHKHEFKKNAKRKVEKLGEPQRPQTQSRTQKKIYIKTEPNRATASSWLPSACHCCSVFSWPGLISCCSTSTCLLLRSAAQRSAAQLLPFPKRKRNNKKIK